MEVSETHRYTVLFCFLRSIIISILLTASTTMAGVIRPWLSLSSLWGQGSSGVAYKESPQNTLEYHFMYDFVWDWYVKDFTYHEVAPSVRVDRYTFGYKYRHQLSQDEHAPFVGYFHPFYFKYPVSIYNELEYRINSVVKEKEYFRTRHVFALYASKDFVNKHEIKPYIATDLFLDWEDIQREKIRLSVGYFMTMDRMTARVYITPWTDGIKEEEWDDNSRLGASVTYKW